MKTACARNRRERIRCGPLCGEVDSCPSNDLIERYLPLARSLARRYRRGAEPVEDLEQLALDVRQAYDDLRGANKSAPTAGEIAAYVGVSVEDVLEAREAYTAMHSESLDRPRKLGDGDAAPLIETIGDRDGEIRRAFERVTLEALLDTLDERQRTIVKLYYQDGSRSPRSVVSWASRRCTSRACCVAPSRGCCSQRPLRRHGTEARRRVGVRVRVPRGRDARPRTHGCSAERT